MLFASFDFLLFVVPVLAAFWLLADRPQARIALIIGASYFFYMAAARPPGGELPPRFTFAALIVVSTLLDYLCSDRIHRLDGALGGDDPRRARSARRTRNIWLAASLVGNLGLLAYFKYTNFFIEAFVDVANASGRSWVAPHLDLILPVGISFYTFQSLSYTIDVWRRRLTPEPNFFKFAAFVVFFPQLVAGPIVRASEFLPQLHRRPRLTVGDVDEAIWRIAKGLFKKVVLGDWIAATFADQIFDTPGGYSSLEVLLALYAFTLQIYADFAGYSDIAIGIARLFGFRIPENFDRPYQARNLGEFWRRWHMTLNTWLRDYVFFPLGGSRVGVVRTYFNVWLTMFLVGMWHGASWNFVIYSNLHGLAMVFNRWNRRRARVFEEDPETQPGDRAPLRGAAAVRAAIGVAVGAVALGVVSAWLGHVALGLDTTLAIRLGLFASVMFALVAALPETGTRFNTFFHVLLTFHFTVLSRIFFRADDLPLARSLSRKIVDWDFSGVRPGLFREQRMYAFFETRLAGTGALQSLALGVAEWAVLAVLVLGLAYHFTPRRWVDEHLRAWFLNLPAPVIGLVYAGLGVLILQLLEGPRANIYFAF